MRQRGSRLLTLRVVMLALAATVLAGPAAIPARADATVRLTGDVVHHLDAATLLGPVAASQPIAVGVALKNPNEAGEDAYLKALYDPNDPNYQNFLDPDQFNLQFGVSTTTLQAAQAWLSNAGLAVSTVPGATNYLIASGTAAQLSAAFDTPINDYTAGGRSFYANAQAPAVPASLPVSTIVGLNNVNRFHAPHIQPATGTPTTTVAAPTGSSVPVTGLLTPQELWSIYDQPSTNFGNGQSMAIFGWGVTPDTVNHLRAFESEFGLPQVPVTVNYYGATSTPRTNDGSDIEWDLDTQASTGMAPDVQSETLYFAEHNTDADILAALTAWVNDKKGPSQGSASFGECENTAAEPVIGSDNLEAPGDAVLKQAVIEGRTLFASTGDTGSSCPIIPVNTNGVSTQAYPALNYPAASPYVTAVGGTVLDSDGGNPPKRFAETAWTYTGGGNSTAIPAASYQADMVPTKCTTDQNGNPYLPGTAPPCRGIPDVAAISGDVATNNGLTITDADGADQQGAGTSLSSPLWLGMWTRIQAAAAKKGLGFANFSLYKIGKSSSYSNDFFDVTVGNNQPYPATPGWDNTTGWGTPDVAHLMQDLTGRLTPVRNLAPPVPAVAAPTTTCGSLFTDAAGDDSLVVEGQTLGAQGADPQLDILGGQILLAPDGQTLRTIITVRNLTTDIPTGGTENDYNFVWFLNGVEYFTQLAVEPGGVVHAYDGQVLHVSLETRFQQLHVDKGVITPGPNGTVEVDVPLANIGSPALGQTLEKPSATAYVRVGVLAGSLQTVDSGGPNANYVLGAC
jgi:subtilase family serine protease